MFAHPVHERVQKSDHISLVIRGWEDSYGRLGGRSQGSWELAPATDNLPQMQVADNSDGDADLAGGNASNDVAPANPPIQSPQPIHVISLLSEDSDSESVDVSTIGGDSDSESGESDLDIPTKKDVEEVLKPDSSSSEEQATIE